MIILNDVTMSFGQKILFKNLNLNIYDGERIGIVGDNGQGKTTLIKLISKVLSPDCGTIKCDQTIAYLPQSSELDTDLIFDKIGDTNFAGVFYSYLKKFKLNYLDINKENISHLSCGEMTKLYLSYVLSQKPSVLILDEPTNHIDYSAKIDVINELKDFEGTLIVVSHDMELLNNVVYKILEVKNGEVNAFVGNYDDYKEQKEQNKLAKTREFEKQTKKIHKLQQDIIRYQNWTNKADANVNKQGGSPSDRRTIGARNSANRSAGKLSRVVKNKSSMLEQEFNNKVEKEYDFHINYKLNSENTRVKNIINFDNVSMEFKDRLLFQNVNLTIKNGDKIALVGDNGSGKTTFINLIMGKIEPTSGIIRKTPTLKIALMSQDIYNLPRDSTIFEIAKENVDTHLFISNLVNMKIDKTRFNTKIKNLSSGEQMKIKLTQLILSDVNMIILDEPTNHLDISNKEFLKMVLKDFKGTLLVVSHDKYFLDGIVDNYLKIENERVFDYK